MRRQAARIVSHRALRLGVAIAFFAVAALLPGSQRVGAADAEPPAVLDGLFAGERTTLALEALEARPVLGPGESFRAVEIARDATSSHHVVSIRGAESPHRHDQHDLLVVILEGYGSMRLGDEVQRVGQGSILWVPRGTVHAFRNASEKPAVAYAVYFPPFDGEDRIPEEE